MMTKNLQFSMASEMERDLISQRTKEALLSDGSTQKFIEQRYGTTAANLNRWIKKHKIRQKYPPFPNFASSASSVVCAEK